MAQGSTIEQALLVDADGTPLVTGVPLDLQAALVVVVADIPALFDAILAELRGISRAITV